jgi:hypothetical protein
MGRTPSQNRLGAWVNHAAGRSRYYYTDPVRAAREAFLQTALNLQSRVVSDLKAIAAMRLSPTATTRALTVWANRWRLTDDWCAVYAKATIERYAVYGGNVLAWDWTIDHDGGGFWGDTPPKPDSTLWKKPEHFVWLARYQVMRESYTAIARGTSPYWIAVDHGRIKQAVADPDAARVRQACLAVADAIGLTLRASPRGNPKLHRSV